MNQSPGYSSSLTVGEASDKYEHAYRIFTEVAAKYSGLKSLWKRTISPNDNLALIAATGTLMPLTLDAAVQAELISRPDDRESLAFKIVHLQLQIMFFASRFKNSGVIRY